MAPDKTSTIGASLSAVLKSQALPCWEGFGLDRLAITAKTMKQFKTQSLPPAIQASVKKRRGSKITRRGPRGFQNTSSFLASWPTDHQAIFRFPALAFIVQGQADFHIADYLVHCPQNHFLLFADDVPRPLGGQPHLAGENRQRHCVVLWFFAPPGTNSITAYLCHSQGEEHWCGAYHIVHCPPAIHLFKLALQELQGQAHNYRLIATLGLQNFLHVLLRELEEGRFHQAGKNNAANSSSVGATPIAQAQEYVQTHLHKSLTAHEVAREIYMSRTSFIRRFTSETGQSFHDYVTAQRMAEAERLLRDGKWSLAFVCRSVGLRPTQLRAQFKKRFGVAPSQFYAQCRVKPPNKHKTDDG